MREYELRSKRQVGDNLTKGVRASRKREQPCERHESKKKQLVLNLKAGLPDDPLKCSAYSMTTLNLRNTTVLPKTHF